MANRFPGPSQLNPSRRRGRGRGEASRTVGVSLGEIGRKKKCCSTREGQREIEREREERKGGGRREKTEVKRYIWLNGRGRATVTVYKAFYIYWIPVVATIPIASSDDKRSSSVTDLLGRERGTSQIPRRACEESPSPSPPPTLLSLLWLQIPRGDCGGDVSRRNLNWTVRRSSPS